MRQSPDIEQKPLVVTTSQDADGLRWAVRSWATRIDVILARVQIRPIQTKWASISTTGRMSLGSVLLTLPKELREPIIVHELVHLLVPNHGKVFKSFMHAYLPDWETREKQLQMQYAKTMS